MKKGLIKIVVGMLLVSSCFVFTACDKKEAPTDGKVSTTVVKDDAVEKVEESKAEVINTGDVIKTEFIEISIGEVSTTNKIKIQTGAYSSLSSEEATAGETLMYLKVNVKSLAGDELDISNGLKAKLLFDDKYNYEARAFGDDIYSLSPLSSRDVYIYASVPNEILEQYKECKVKLGFEENLEWSSDEFEELPYQYELTVLP